MNVGAVLRTCCFLGVDKVVVCNKNWYLYLLGDDGITDYGSLVHH